MFFFSFLCPLSFWNHVEGYFCSITAAWSSYKYIPPTCVRLRHWDLCVLHTKHEIMWVDVQKTWEDHVCSQFWYWYSSSIIHYSLFCNFVLFSLCHFKANLQQQTLKLLTVLYNSQYSASSPWWWHTVVSFYWSQHNSILITQTTISLTFKPGCH